MFDVPKNKKLTTQLQLYSLILTFFMGLHEIEVMGLHEIEVREWIKNRVNYTHLP